MRRQEAGTWTYIHVDIGDYLDFWEDAHLSCVVEEFLALCIVANRDRDWRMEMSRKIGSFGKSLVGFGDMMKE